ncbi:anthranilate phosphoribosyltransferase [Egicoccus halophilus]|uniref:Anthranilate phosphoribosyltransferase n=1 Tax=Egicoccus halophilus TaxID=1670830 RepID=A0A8J3ESE8_9ACTN|nr:anthranilate phosphoribosyltransferase [Egicoccus halophilus]GGI07243.1 anthranilate phosphoribosyltransferase [Egicoccus halophilus]
MTDEPFRWSEVFSRLLHGEHLDEATAAEVMGTLMRGEAEPAQVAALLVALRAKGESPAEIAGFVRAMLAEAEPIDLDPGVAERLVDTCGTGGDGANTFNISTVAAVVTAAAGQPVAKHGNRAASGVCGSADLLEAWGVAIELPPAAVSRCVTELGIGFLFARSFHPAMRHVAPVRAQLGIRTAFNVLGPLSNPAGAPFQVVGVSDARLAPVMAEALVRLGKRHVLVFRGADGLDELTTTGPSTVWEVRDARVAQWELDPVAFGFAAATLADLRGGSVEENVAIADAVLAGEPGAPSDIVVLNAAAALYAADAVADLAAGVEAARTAIDSGAARELRDRWVQRTKELSTQGRAHG